jgi:hypothetical protein
MCTFDLIEHLNYKNLTTQIRRSNNIWPLLKDVIKRKKLSTFRLLFFIYIHELLLLFIFNEITFNY